MPTGMCLCAEEQTRARYGQARERGEEDVQHEALSVPPNRRLVKPCGLGEHPPGCIPGPKESAEARKRGEEGVHREALVLRQTRR